MSTKQVPVQPVLKLMLIVNLMELMIVIVLAAIIFRILFVPKINALLPFLTLLEIVKVSVNVILDM